MSETHTTITASDRGNRDDSSSSSSSSVKMEEKPYSKSFFDKSNLTARRIYFKALFAGSFLVIITILSILAIYWGSLWKTPVGSLDAWVVDFDQGVIGQAVVQGLIDQPSHSKLRFTSIPANDFPGGPSDLNHAVIEERAWAIVSINPGASARLQSSYGSPNASYDGSEAVTLWAAEARNENAYRVLTRPTINDALERISTSFASNAARQLSSSSSSSSSTSIPNILATSPQTLIAPISFSIHNAAPFDHPVALAVTFVGLIYMIILSQFIVMIATSARDAAGFNRSLSFRSIIITRLASSFGLYFIISLFFSLLSLAFQLDFTRRFGRAGFFIFWMLNWVGMLSLGLALESLITILTPRFVPFFMVTWIIVNVSVAVFPLETLPSIYKYGYSMPFYNVSHAVRCIVFGTRNQIGMNFGILIAWTAISCITLVFFQWFVRRGDTAVASRMEVREAPRGTSQQPSHPRPSLSRESSRRVSGDDGRAHGREGVPAAEKEW